MDGYIDQVEPVFWDGQHWSQTHEVEEAERALISFDRQAIFDEADRLAAPERIRAAPGCPICGVIG